MIDIDLPPNAATITLLNNAQVFSSKLSGTSQYTDYPGSRWAVSVSWFNRTNAEGRRLFAKMNALNGPINVLKLPIPDIAQKGTAAGSGKVDGAGQQGTTLVTDGWTPNQTNLLETGDWIEVNQQAFMIASDVSSDSSGNATITITPAIRKTPADDQDIIVSSPSFYMRLVAGSQTSSDLSPSFSGPLYAFGFDAVEID
jgi:hypothetical protein